MAIKYSDGDSVESEILNLVRAAEHRSSSDRIAAERYGEWAVRYHLSPQRANLVRHFDFRGLDVLELGAGMGAVSRFIAEEAKTLTCVEGTENRMAVLRERLKDLTNWTGIVANIQDVELEAKFDVVCVIGVMEYSELFIAASGDKTPFDVFLEKAKTALKPGGVLVLAIENKLGLKYWNGASEDHSARLFDGVCGYPAAPTAKTFSKKGLTQLLRSGGFTTVDHYYPFPDYKIPSTVLSAALVDEAPELAADLAGHEVYEDYSSPRLKYYPDTLALRSLAEAGLLSEFSNSFLFVGTLDKNSPIREKLLSKSFGGEKGWHYAISRRIPTRTVFTDEGGQIKVRKEALTKKTAAGKIAKWKAPKPEALQSGNKLRSVLTRAAYFDEWATFQTTMSEFIRWSLRKWDDGAGGLHGESFDAIYLNAIPKGDGDFALFDLEWTLNEPMAKSWFVFRNVYGLVRDFDLYGAGAPFRSLQDLYEQLCRNHAIIPDFDGDLAREVALQMEATGVTNEATFVRTLRDCFSIPVGPRFPRLAREELTLREEIVALKVQNRHLTERLSTLTHKLADRLNVGLKKLPGVHGPLKKVLSSVSAYAKNH